jgi:hypothetical protein
MLGEPQRMVHVMDAPSKYAVIFFFDAGSVNFLVVCIFPCIFVFTVCLCNTQNLLDYLLAVIARSALFLFESVLNCKECLCNFFVLFRQLL